MNKTHKQQLELEGIEIMTREGIEHFENQIKTKQTGTRGHSVNALDGIQTRAMGWMVGFFVVFFLADGSENLAVSHAVRTASDSQTADTLDGILESEPTSRF